MATTIKGELYTDYNGEMSKTHLVTSYDLVRGFEEKVAELMGENVVRNTQANLNASDTVYDKGTFVFETDTKKLKVADGEHGYKALSYIKGDSKYVMEVMGTDGKYHEV